MSPAFIDKAVETEARDWFLRLVADEATQEDFVAWNGWIEASPAHRQAYDAVSMTWELAGAASVERATAAELAADAYVPTVSVAAWRRRMGNRRLVWAAAAACAAAVVLVAIAPSRLAEPVQRLETLRAQHLQTKLADGSTVQLGAMTAAAFALDARSRRLELERGEVLVQVAHEPRRPFIVDTPLAAVTAVGTAFNIDVRPTGVEIYVTEGIVAVDVSRQGGRQRVRTEGETVVRVTMGQRIKVSREISGRIQILQQLDTPPPMWAEGWLQYRDEPLTAVLADVNRYYGRRIVLGDPALGSLLYSGSVGLTRIPEWLAGLERAFPVSIVERGGELLLTRKEPAPRRAGRI